MSMMILALDLGTKTGWAYGDKRSGLQMSGTKELATKKELRHQPDPRAFDIRVCRFAQLLDNLPIQPDLIVFEDVQFAVYTLQVQLWSSLRAVVWAQGCRDGGAALRAVPVGTLKKFATGHGNATKGMMAAHLFKSRPNLKRSEMDDNEVDAIHLFYYAQKNL